MTVSHQATMNGYHKNVWFSGNDITNNIELSNLRLKSLVTYRSNEMMLIIHRDSEEKPIMQFRMHEIGLDSFYPRDQELTFFNRVSDIKECFTERQTKVVEVIRDLNTTLIFPSDKDYKWVICSN